MDYKWLWNEGAPKMLVESLKFYGTLETQGKASNKVIMSWAQELGLNRVYSDDSVPWCGLYHGMLANRAGYELPKNPLWARAWATWGEAVPIAKLGYTLVFTRGSAGHVSQYVGEDKTCYHCLGGNQGDKVGIVRMLKTRIFAIRRPLYKIGEPANVRQIHLSNTGIISSNEL